MLSYHIKFAPLKNTALPKSIGPKRLLTKVSRLKTLDFHSIGKHKWVLPSILKKLHVDNLYVKKPYMGWYQICCPK